MPQADLFFTADKPLHAREILAQIQGVIAGFDTTAGACKGRAHPISDYHHSHVLLRLSMLPKPHRDDAYAAELGRRLMELLKQHVAAPCIVNVQIRFDLVHYTTLALD